MHGVSEYVCFVLREVILSAKSNFKILWETI